MMLLEGLPDTEEEGTLRFAGATIQFESIIKANQKEGRSDPQTESGSRLSHMKMITAGY